MPSNVERRERFLRVSKKRLKKALDAIESISSLDEITISLTMTKLPKFLHLCMHL